MTTQQQQQRPNSEEKNPSPDTLTEFGQSLQSGMETINEGANKLERTLHGIRHMMFVNHENREQLAYQKRTREGHEAMAKAAGFPVDDEDDTASHFIVAAEGSTVNVGQENQPQASDKPVQIPTPAPVTAQPVQQPAKNGSLLKTAAVVVGSMVGGGSLLGAGALLYSALSKQPQTEVIKETIERPAEQPPEARFRIR